LLEWAKFNFELDKSDDNGTTLREHLEQLERQTGGSLAALEPPKEFPLPLVPIWSAFVALHSARTAGFSGPNPITYSEILAWKTLTESPLKPWEIEVIKQVDKVYMEVAQDG